MKKFIFLIALIFSFPSFGNEISGYAQVVDGDSIIINNNMIRIKSIDAPEYQQKCILQEIVWDCGKDSKKLLKNIIKNKVVNCTWKKTDKYKRKLAKCFIKGNDIGAEMVKQGMAVVYKKYSTEYETIENEAREKKIGIWKSEFEMPWKYRQTNRK